MIRRLYVHNFRCLENFELNLRGLSSALLIGNNGSGKSTVGFVLEILQKIARGTNRVSDLLDLKDLSRGRSDVPVRFELEAELGDTVFEYTLALELPAGGRELRVLEERLSANGQSVLWRKNPGMAIDWHLVALPVVQSSSGDPLSVFRRWLSRALILRPIPALISGESRKETLEPEPQLGNLAAWFSGLLAHAPSAYTTIYRHLKELMPDLKDIRNPAAGTESRTLVMQFAGDQGSLVLPFGDLSDGEKCFLIGALVVASNEAVGPLFCFWDEPDNYLAPSEVGHFVLAIRTAFERKGQFIATSHNSEAIQRFSDENTLVLSRRSHLEPAIVRTLGQIGYSGDLVSALVRGDIEP